METERLWTSKEIAELFRVDPRTVTRWARQGRFGRVMRTPGGGGIRVPESVVRQLCQEQAS